ncbi:MAG TPA: glycosyltransferase family 39 protein [Patescibacteria group bacterium]
MAEKESGGEFSLKSFFSPFTTLRTIHWIILIGFIVFLNGLFNSFVGDDLGQIVENPLVHSIGNISLFFSSSTFYNGSTQLIGNYFRPIYISFFSIIYSLFGPSFFAYHLFQLIFHITNTILIFVILKRFLNKHISFFLSLIFLIHPINSEVVMYIAHTQEVLFLFFGLMYLLMLNYKSFKYFLFANIFLLLSILSKESGILFLFISFFWTLFFERKNLIKNSLSGGLVILIYLVLRFHAIGFISSPHNSPIAQANLYVRLLNIPEMFFFYLKTFIFPIQLSSSYQWVITNINFDNFYLPLFIDLGFLVLFFGGGWVLYQQKGRATFYSYLFFLLWFLLGIGIHMQIIPLDATVSEAWFYFPIIGLLGMIGIFFSSMKVKIKPIWFVLLGFVIISLLSLRTFIRTFDWRNEFTIATHDLKVSSSAWGLENELSYAYFSKNDYKNAKIHAQKSINLHPFMTNYINLGAADFALGNYKEAKNAFLTSLKYGDLYQTYENLGFLALSYGDPKESILFLKNALKKYPNDAKLWMCLAALEYNFGDKEMAKIDINRAYLLEQTSQIVGVYNAIISSQPVRIPLTTK